MEKVNQTEFAKLIGVSKVAVHKMIKSGKIPVDDKGKIPKDEALKAYSASKNVSFDSNRDGKGGGRGGAGVSKSNPPPRSEPRAATSSFPPDAHGAKSGTMSIAKINEETNKAKMAQAILDAKLKELQYKEKKGELVLAVDVERRIGQLAGVLRQRFINLPTRLAPIIEGKDRSDIQKIIQDEIAMIMQEMSDEFGGGIGGGN